MRNIFKFSLLGLVIVLFALYFQPKTKKIMFVGDSITKGYEGRIGYEFGYRDHLESLITGYTVVGPYVDKSGRHHAGRGGDTTKDLLGRIDSDLTYMKNASKHSAILIHIGTNDVIMGLSDSISNLDHIIEKIDRFNPNIDIYVALIIPSYEKSVINYNSKLYWMIRDYKKKNLYIVNMYSIFSENLMCDQNHPNDKGYQEMAKAWAEAIH